MAGYQYLQSDAANPLRPNPGPAQHHRRLGQEHWLLVAVSLQVDEARTVTGDFPTTVSLAAGRTETHDFGLNRSTACLAGVAGTPAARERQVVRALRGCRGAHHRIFGRI
jgi:hypothetical protein